MVVVVPCQIAAVLNPYLVIVLVFGCFRRDKDEASFGGGGVGALRRDSRRCGEEEGGGETHRERVIDARRESGEG